MTAALGDRNWQFFQQKEYAIGADEGLGVQ